MTRPMIRRWIPATTAALSFLLASAPLLAAAADDASRTGEVVAPPNKGLISAIVTLVVFLGLLFILTKYAWGPIVAGLKKREDKIRDDLAQAEAALAKANAVLAQYNAQVAGGEAQVRAMLTEATANAEKIKASIRTQAEADANELREKAKREVQSEKDAAIREIQDLAVVISTQVAEKILKRDLNADDNRALVRNSLEQLASVQRN